ncbi:NUDIX domain-containing protein [Hydrogenimonas sp.]
MKRSAGILPFHKREDGEIELFLVHMGGPFWKNRPYAWSIVKGEIEEGEDPLEAAKREFFEETGERIDGDFLSIGSVKSSNKTITAWAVEASPDTNIRSNTFEIEWPPKSGKTERFPEVDRAGWFTIDEAEKIIVRSQLPFLKRVRSLLQSD